MIACKCLTHPSLLSRSTHRMLYSTYSLYVHPRVTQFAYKSEKIEPLRSSLITALSVSCIRPWTGRLNKPRTTAASRILYVLG